MRLAICRFVDGYNITTRTCRTRLHTLYTAVYVNTVCIHAAYEVTKTKKKIKIKVIKVSDVGFRARTRSSGYTRSALRGLKLFVKEQNA